MKFGVHIQGALLHFKFEYPLGAYTYFSREPEKKENTHNAISLVIAERSREIGSMITTGDLHWRFAPLRAPHIVFKEGHLQMLQ